MSTSSTERTSRFRSPIHNPLPASLSSECKKAGKILDSFVSPQFITLDSGIPRKVLARAKGLVIFTCFKSGFIFSGRFGSGLIVARLADGSWSAPSAIGTFGGGIGGQGGLELTDFVFVLNTDAAVRAITQSGSITLGGNVSLALGPVGRSVEAMGAMGNNGTAGMFAYSKTRGVFCGISFEFSMLGERPDANRKMYKQKVTAKQLLTGEIAPPSGAEPLMSVLNRDIFRADSSIQLPTELRSGDLHAEAAELPAEPSDEPSQGVPELDNQQSNSRTDEPTA
ncbi:hypothetical protein MAP00_008618 [Monascus purpureus]|nr:hypothetical protein MAP00_008618 [Monascus purpureus]